MANLPKQERQYQPEQAESPSAIKQAFMTATGCLVNTLLLAVTVVAIGGSYYFLYGYKAADTTTQATPIVEYYAPTYEPTVEVLATEPPAVWYQPVDIATATPIVESTATLADFQPLPLQPLSEPQLSPTPFSAPENNPTGDSSWLVNIAIASAILVIAGGTYAMAK